MVAEKIGLLPGFSWTAGHGFWATLAICWCLTPIGHMLVGAIGESRFVPLDSWNGRQFWSFFPGDLFLGWTAALLLVLAQRLPSEPRWYNSTWWHAAVLLGCALVALVLTYGEWKSGAYPTRAILSPTKLYHNGVLYIGFGYVIVSTLVACLFGAPLQSVLLALVPGIFWVGMLAIDNTPSASDAAERARHAHVADWRPIWSR